MADTDRIVIRMRKTVRPDIPLFAEPGTILYYDQQYDAQANKYGAVSGICRNGKALGVKPGEFEFVEAPEWLLNIWRSDNGK